MTDQQLYFAIGVPTLAVFLNLIVTLVVILTSSSQLSKRIDLLDRDLREWAKIVMQHNTDIARLKDKTGLP
jgi:hypothetical protein